jgi:hypothetical protein
MGRRSNGLLTVTLIQVMSLVSLAVGIFILGVVPLVSAGDELTPGVGISVVLGDVRPGGWLVWILLAGIVAAVSVVFVGLRIVAQQALSALAATLLSAGWIAISSMFPAVLLGAAVEELAPESSVAFAGWFPYWVTGAVSFVAGIVLAIVIGVRSRRRPMAV